MSEMVSGNELARRLGVSETAVRKHVKKGLYRPNKAGQFDADACEKAWRMNRDPDAVARGLAGAQAVGSKLPPGVARREFADEGADGSGDPEGATRASRACARQGRTDQDRGRHQGGHGGRLARLLNASTAQHRRSALGSSDLMPSPPSAWRATSWRAFGMRSPGSVHAIGVVADGKS